MLRFGHLENIALTAIDVIVEDDIDGGLGDVTASLRMYVEMLMNGTDRNGKNHPKRGEFWRGYYNERLAERRAQIADKEGRIQEAGGEADIRAAGASVVTPDKPHYNIDPDDIDRYKKSK